MIIAVIVLAWLLVNTWLTILITVIDGVGVSYWDEFFTLLLCAVITPWLCLLISEGVRKIRRAKRKRKR
jgi:hypothetical protein